jgi:hypothetical protein
MMDKSSSQMKPMKNMKPVILTVNHLSFYPEFRGIEFEKIYLKLLPKRYGDLESKLCRLMYRRCFSLDEGLLPTSLAQL